MQDNADKNTLVIVERGCLSSAYLSAIFQRNKDYLVLALVLMHWVQAFTRWPLKTEYCKLGSNLRIEALMEWERFIVREYILPHWVHIRGIGIIKRFKNRKI